ncbi:hypothetical protein SPRG_01960 [Saprolegnia parasitica CBS 223.65]|uniref:6-phosphogluconolactonase n=1 Tax=Saprolegnia parasitica (strain CBS 223.65) TaxID=695850 RepID=A0A067CRM8_SAPPC|nr:hypothetical protein SPRG_01960 [Saprolegnia parasitica CBS 223.65]KDO33148.1 hypothetical protein SPRG_01960 [Saprolegnia parasitica CBS 223.65]|eukprot:XP_012195913.1 hypothetical protein SPRG_01960 [Saprolegnia parasitica CBS 223.65]
MKTSVLYLFTLCVATVAGTTPEPTLTSTLTFELLAATPMPSTQTPTTPKPPAVAPTTLQPVSLLLVGARTDGSKASSPGITVYDASKSPLQQLFSVSSTLTGNMPTFMALTQDKNYLYVTNEVAAGQIVSFAIDRSGASPTLKRLGATSTNSNGPVHIAVTSNQRFALVASYTVGSITVRSVVSSKSPVLAIDPTTKVASRMVSQVVFPGAARVVPGRQDIAHAHCVTLSPDNNYVFVTDLGNDKIMQFKFNPTTGTLLANSPAFVTVSPGALPRHTAFHPSGKQLYLAVKTTQVAGVLTGAIRITADGRYILVTNRYGGSTPGDSIAVFAADLTPIGNYVLKAWAGARDFALGANNTVIVGEENTNTFETFQLQANGQLVPTKVAQPWLFKPQVLLPLS